MSRLLLNRLELNGHRRRLTWEATPRSIHDGVQSAINTSDCLVFDTNIAQLFADTGNLGINVTINMCWSSMFSQSHSRGGNLMCPCVVSAAADFLGRCDDVWMRVKMGRMSLVLGRSCRTHQTGLVLGLNDSSLQLWHQCRTVCSWRVACEVRFSVVVSAVWTALGIVQCFGRGKSGNCHWHSFWCDLNKANRTSAWKKWIWDME